MPLGGTQRFLSRVIARPSRELDSGRAVRDRWIDTPFARRALHRVVPKTSSKAW
jgi:hypothetical protein